MLIGLCGQSGVGKGYVAKIFSEYSVPSIDTDLVYRSITSASEKPSDCVRELVSCFGESVIADDNSLNRAALRKLVFGDNKENLKLLNEITHKYILEETLGFADKLYSEGYEFILIDAPVLFESGFDKLCGKIIAVTAPKEKQIARLMRRDGLDRESIERRLNSQISEEELISRTDFVIHNYGDDSEMRKEIESIVSILRSASNNIETVK